jgi:renalase
MDSFQGDTRQLAEEIAIVGAGLAGLMASRTLQQRGLQAFIIEKSQGVGGRLATRRRDRLCFDHGLPAWFDGGEGCLEILELAQSILNPWSLTAARWQDGAIQPLDLGGTRYSAENGITAIAKALAQDLTVYREWQLQQIVLKDEHWLLKNSQGQTFLAKALIMAIPAPQAMAILETSAIADLPDWMPTLGAIAYDPCVVVMAGYQGDGLKELGTAWQWLELETHTHLSRIVLDSHKRAFSSDSIYIFYSTADFAHLYDRATDLTDAGETLLKSAGETIHPALRLPQWVQVHRWRYAFPRLALATNYWQTEKPLPLLCCGDGFGTEQVPIERAIVSGVAAAEQLADCLLS